MTGKKADFAVLLPKENLARMFCIHPDTQSVYQFLDMKSFNV